MLKKVLISTALTLMSVPALAASDNALTCMATNLYHEARGEAPVGAIAAGHVVLNRVRDKHYPNNVCAVIKQGGDRLHKCQFSWWCDGKSDKTPNKETYTQMLKYSKMLLSGKVGDPSGGALFYHTADVTPYWSDSKDYVVRLGYHKFYK